MSMDTQSNIYSHFLKFDPILARWIARTDYQSWLNLENQTAEQQPYFTSLCRHIIGQQLSNKAANAIWQRALTAVPEALSDPAILIQLPLQTLRELGISWAKARSLMDLSQKVLSGDLLLDKVGQASDEQIIHQLTFIKGVGPWTAQMFLIFTLKRPDVFSMGDLGLKKGFAKVYGLPALPSVEEMESVTSTWKPYRTFGSIALWNALE